MPEVRQQIPSAASQRLHVTDIKEILIPNLGDVNPTGAEVILRARAAFRSRGSVQRWHLEQLELRILGVTHRSNTTHTGTPP